MVLNSFPYVRTQSTSKQLFVHGPWSINTFQPHYLQRLESKMLNYIFLQTLSSTKLKYVTKNLYHLIFLMASKEIFKIVNNCWDNEYIYRSKIHSVHLHRLKKLSWRWYVEWCKPKIKIQGIIIYYIFILLLRVTY